MNNRSYCKGLPPQSNQEVHETDLQSNRMDGRHQKEQEIRAQAIQALNDGDHVLVFRLLASTEFEDGVDLIAVWDEAHYGEEEKRLGHSLTPLSRFRIRQKYPPPLTICPTGKRKSAALPGFSTQVLKAWIVAHRASPYPTRVEKATLAEKSQLTLAQVKTWFANARRRMKKPTKGRELDVTHHKSERHHPYRPIAPYPEIALDWVRPDSAWTGTCDPGRSVTTIHPATQPPEGSLCRSCFLPPISSFMPKSTVVPMSQEYSGLFGSNCSTHNVWPPNGVSSYYTQTGLPTPSVDSLSNSMNLEYGSIIQRSAFKPLKLSSTWTTNILRPQPIRLLPTASGILQQSFHMTQMLHHNSHIDRARSGLDSGTAQLDVAITLANMRGQ